MTLTVLFWNFNIDKGDWLSRRGSMAEKAAILASLATEHGVDVLAITECRIPEAVLLDALRDADPRYELPDNPHDRIRFYSRFPGRFLEPWHADGRLAVRRLLLDGYQDLLLAAFHYIDRRNNGTIKQWGELAPYRQTLLKAERKAEHTRTILFGDLNMNPYEVGMLDHRTGLGAMMTWDLAEGHSGNKGGQRFYNPMWAVMGKPEAPGTCYWADNDPGNPYWNCLDGVLLRPALRSAFRGDDLVILRSVTMPGGGRVDLIRRARVHWKITHSDHLPILFKLNLPVANAT